MKVDFSAIGRISDRLQKLKNPPVTQLLETWEKIIVEDNRRGILAGTDKNGNLMTPVTYRPKPESVSKWGKSRQRKLIGAATAPEHNNLTSAQYRRLSGPSLAPRSAYSRVITNLATGHGYDPISRVYFAEAVWFDVVSRNGIYFLPYHFNGGGRLPVRDLRGVRPWGKQRVWIEFLKWSDKLLRDIKKEK